MPKPKGSGCFALAAGVAFLSLFVASIWFNLSTVSPYVAFQVWLIFAGAVMLGWGGHRVRTGERGDWRVGQPTINFVVGVLAATIGLFALVSRAP